MGCNFTGKALAGNILTPLDDQVNRNAKDSVFCDLFAQPEYLLQMYAVLHPEDDVTSITDITLVTLDHKLLNAQYNDLGFIVGNRLMILVEHQSTWTVNILIRFLMYLGETYQRYIRNNHINIYSTRTVELPKPELYVIYPGERGNRPDEISYCPGKPSPVGNSRRGFYALCSHRSHSPFSKVEFTYPCCKPPAPVLN